MTNNPVSPTDVTFMSLALLSGSATFPALLAHDFAVAGGAALLAIIFSYLYHSFGSPSVPEGTTPVVTQNLPATSATQVTIVPAIPVPPVPVITP